MFVRTAAGITRARVCCLLGSRLSDSVLLRQAARNIVDLFQTNLSILYIQHTQVLFKRQLITLYLQLVQVKPIQTTS